MPAPTTADACLLFLEMQPEIIPSSVTVAPDALRRAVGIACRAAGKLDVPVFASIVPMAPDTAPSAVEEVAATDPIVRTTIAALDHPPLRDRIAASGAKRLVIGGMSAEIGVLHTALGALREGYQVEVLVDCTGGLSDRTEQSALRQLEQASIRLSNLSSFLTSLATDMAEARGQAVMQSVGELWGWGG